MLQKYKPTLITVIQTALVVVVMDVIAVFNRNLTIFPPNRQKWEGTCCDQINWLHTQTRCEHLIVRGLWKSNWKGLLPVRTLAAKTLSHRSSATASVTERGLRWWGNPPDLTSSHPSPHVTHTHTLDYAGTQVGAHMKNLHSKNTWAQTDTFCRPRGQTVTWRGLGAVECLLTSHFTAALHSLFVFREGYSTLLSTGPTH